MHTCTADLHKAWRSSQLTLTATAAHLVLGRRLADEAGVVDEAVLGRLVLRLQRPEERLCMVNNNVRWCFQCAKDTAAAAAQAQHIKGVTGTAAAAHVQVCTFSAPRICTVDAGYFASVISEPACAMRRAPTSSPTNT